MLLLLYNNFQILPLNTRKVMFCIKLNYVMLIIEYMQFLSFLSHFRHCMPVLVKLKYTFDHHLRLRELYIIRSKVIR